MFEYACNICRIVDGDTVDVDIDLGFGVWLRNERVRLYGINAPETRTRDADEKAAGLIAKTYLQGALGASAVLKSLDFASGKYGRVLGVFFVDGENINATLLDKGMASENYYGKPVAGRVREIA